MAQSSASSEDYPEEGVNSDGDTHGSGADFIIIPSLLSTHEVGSFTEFCKENVSLSPAEHFSENGDEDMPRKSAVAWLSPPAAATSDPNETFCPKWLFERLVVAIRRGADTWPKVLPEALRRGTQGCVSYEHVQYTTYDKGEHYQQWHLDGKPPSMRNENSEDLRALSVVVLLEPASHGGEFETWAGSGEHALKHKKVVPVPLRRGDAIVLPAQRLWHRVKAVKDGQRSSLVFWASPTTAKLTPGSKKRERVSSYESFAETKAGVKVQGTDDGDDGDAEWREIERKFEADELNGLHDDYDDDAASGEASDEPNEEEEESAGKATTGRSTRKVDPGI